jgi:hypothetical protein
MSISQVLDVIFANRKWAQFVVRGAAPTLTVLVQMADPRIAMGIDLLWLSTVLNKAYVGFKIIYYMVSRNLVSVRSVCDILNREARLPPSTFFENFLGRKRIETIRAYDFPD